MRMCALCVHVLQSTYILKSVIDALFLTIRNLGNSELLSGTMSEVMLTGMISHPRSVQRVQALVAHFFGCLSYDVGVCSARSQQCPSEGPELRTS